MSMHPLGPGSAQIRHYFEDDTQFHDRPDLIPLIISAYHKASQAAAFTARTAVAIGTDEHRQRALWDEAVAETLELVLNCLATEHSSGEWPPEQGIDLPERPEFIR